MHRDGPTFYDDQAVFLTYQRHRQRDDTPNDTLEKPCLLSLTGSVSHTRILDLGCGDAAIGREFLAQGATSYVGVEGSARMVELATKMLADTGGHVVHQAIEQYLPPSDAFDVVIARLSLHYVADLAPVCRSIFQSLAAAGLFVFSVEHPVITSSDRGWTAGTPRQDWVVDDYFVPGIRVTNWLGGSVAKYHRTIEDYLRLIQDAGFVIERLREAQPQREHFRDEQTYERRKRIPLFLLLAARKPA